MSFTIYGSTDNEYWKPLKTYTTEEDCKNDFLNVKAENKLQDFRFYTYKEDLR